MIKMIDKQLIWHKYRVDLDSKRKISRDLNLNRKTIDKIVKAYELTQSSTNPEESLDTLMTTAPKYQSTPRKRRVLTDSIKSLISDYLDENRHKCDTGLSKQCKSNQIIWELLIKQGHTISYPSVCKYVSTLKKNNKAPLSVFIRAHYEPGDICEFDWGEVKLKIGGRRISLQMAIFTLAHSNGRYAYLFRHQNTLAFMESHRNFYKAVKGVPQLMVYDNMRVAISKFTGRDKHPTEALMRLSTFYKFAFRFCNVRAGWEKGHVERSVSVVRQAAFANKDSFATIEEANSYLAIICDSLNRRKEDSVKADIESLQPQVNTIGCFEMSGYKVDKWSTICMKAVHYSIPDHLVGKMVDVKIYSEKIVIFHDGAKIATHERIYTPGEWSVKLEHYLTTLQQKPGAVASSVALKQASSQVQHLFNSCFKNAPRDFVILLHYITDNHLSMNDVLIAFKGFRDKGINQPSVDQIKVAISSNRETLETVFNDYSSDDFREIEQNSIWTLDSLTGIMNNTTVTNNNNNNNTQNGPITHNTVS